MSTEKDPLTPSLALLCKLGSVIVHVEEMLSPTGNMEFDVPSLKAVLNDPGLRAWLGQMQSKALLPVKR